MTGIIFRLSAKMHSRAYCPVLQDSLQGVLAIVGVDLQNYCIKVMQMLRMGELNIR
jgi:hypothetical protein